jgi:[ribosomal protein S5]-alanine N-acetyltransferase
LNRVPKVVRLVELCDPVINALAAGDLTTANRAATVTLTPYLVDAGSIRVWQRRSRQIEIDPLCRGWITRAILDLKCQEVVGRAGYHGPPDRTGMVEVGYAVDPAYRRQGYARAALVALLDRASREPSVRRVRATISPDNTTSRHLVAQYGFVEVGEQWDDDDGLETIFEVEANALRSWTGTCGEVCSRSRFGYREGP